MGRCFPALASPPLILGAEQPPSKAFSCCTVKFRLANFVASASPPSRVFSLWPPVSVSDEDDGDKPAPNAAAVPAASRLAVEPVSASADDDGGGLKPSLPCQPLSQGSRVVVVGSPPPWSILLPGSRAPVAVVAAAWFPGPGAVALAFSPLRRRCVRSSPDGGDRSQCSSGTPVAPSLLSSARTSLVREATAAAGAGAITDGGRSRRIGISNSSGRSLGIG